MKLRRILYRIGVLKSEKIIVPIISIGNLSMGGTGKTPVTLHIADHCIETLKKRTAIVLRGYKRKSLGYLLVSDGTRIIEDVLRSGDEAQLYAKELPDAIVICDEDRVRGARMAVALGAEVILLDDGFQHQRLKRDLNILLINSEEGIPPTLPFGKGRENSSAIKDADIIIQTNFDEKIHPALEFSQKPVVFSRTVLSSVNLYSGDEEIDALPEILNGEKILVLSGIAHPERFERSLAEFATLIISYRLDDHSEYDLVTLEKVAAKAKLEKCTMIATTTKDAVKMLENYIALQQKDNSLPPIAVIHSSIEFIGGDKLLFSKINNLFKK